MGISLSMNFRTAENVSFASLNFGSLSVSSFWSGQLMVPTSPSPSFLTVRVDVRFGSPPSDLAPPAPAGPAALLLDRQGGRPLRLADLVAALPRPDRIGRLLVRRARQAACPE